MEQRELAIFGLLQPPKPVTREVVASCNTYREACRMAWELRRIKGMTKAQLAVLAGLYASHVTDYLHPDDKPSRRDLPASKVADFEDVVGVRLVSQWLATRSQLTVLEQFQAERLAA